MVCADLKKVYGAVNLEDAEYAKEEFREKWDKKYPSILHFWDENWADLVTFSSIRPKSAGWFTPQMLWRASVYLSVKEITKKWTPPIRNWGLIFSQIVIFFVKRLRA